MNTTYICTTNYHILIILLKSKVNLFVPNSSEFDVITMNLKKEKIFNRIVRLDYFIYNSKNRNTNKKRNGQITIRVKRCRKYIFTMIILLYLRYCIRKRYLIM